MLDGLRFVILRSFLGSICLFVQSYSSLYSFTHKQIDHQKEPRNLTKLIYRNALNCIFTQKQGVFAPKGIILPINPHAFKRQKHTDFRPRALLLAGKTLWGRLNGMSEACKFLYISTIPNTLIFGVFAGGRQRD